MVDRPRIAAHLPDGGAHSVLRRLLHLLVRQAEKVERDEGLQRRVGHAEHRHLPPRRSKCVSCNVSGVASTGSWVAKKRRG